MIVWITKATVENISFLASPAYEQFQFWVCLLFLTDIAVEWSLSPRKWHYIAVNIFFILISIPWINLVEYFGVHLSPMGAYILRFVPMIRAGYVLAIVSGALTSNKALSMMAVYIIWVVVSVYFGALVFFVEEHYINPLVDTFWSALWWASLNITTVGCEIHPYTATGKALAIILSGEGLILFPVFTVYVTNAVVGRSSTSDSTSDSTPDSSSDSTPDDTASTGTTASPDSTASTAG